LSNRSAGSEPASSLDIHAARLWASLSPKGEGRGSHLLLTCSFNGSWPAMNS
jgi:hypothetical protein